MRTAIQLTVLATALACSTASAPAQARARVFVASYGNDSNPCTFGSPCKTFQQAVNVVDAAGEVTAIDSAGFGPINITKAVTITSPDGVEAGVVPVAGGNAIDINAGQSDAIVLHGLTLNGSGVGANGIVFNSGSILTVQNCVIRNLTGQGIDFVPSTSSSLSVLYTYVGSNGGYGILVQPSGSASASAVVDHVEAQYNGAFAYGIALDGHSTSGLVNGTVTDSVSSNNGDGFLVLSNGTMGINGNLMVMRSLAANNHTGLQSSAGAGFDLNAPFLRISQTIVTNNVIPCSGLVQSYGDNTVNNNQQQDTCGIGLIQKE